MVANSVSGSFRGIEISFNYNGPHVVMSVLNTTEEGKLLRVMFQQQPRSGRVNWTTFQLTGQLQEVVVPSEVIQSHKLAFYVDNHEPIATYTDKIIEELKEIQEKSILDNPPNVSGPELDQQSSLLTKNDGFDASINNQDTEETPTGIHKDKVIDPTSEVKPDVTDDTDEVQISTKVDDVKQNETSDEKTGTPSTASNTNTSDISNGPQPKDQNDVVDMLTSEAKLDVLTNRKPKTTRISRPIPDVNTELQFRIKVPSLPMSATKKQMTYMPVQTAKSSATNQQKQGFFGNLAGAFGLSFANKKQFYVEQNKHLHDRFHADLEKMEDDYNNGNGISLESWDIEALNEQQTAVLLLNLMVNEISEWKKEAQKAESTKVSLAKSLEEIEKELKRTLKHTRGINAPSPTLFPDRNARF